MVEEEGGNGGVVCCFLKMRKRRKGSFYLIMNLVLVYTIMEFYFTAYVKYNKKELLLLL